MRTPMRLICALSCALGVIFTNPALAQSDTARLQGTVLDQSGAVVPGAAVKVTNKSTNFTEKTTTDNTSGIFSFKVFVPETMKCR